MSIGIYLSFPFSKSPIKGLEWGRFRYQAKKARIYLDSLQLEVASADYSSYTVKTVLFGAGDWSLVPAEDLTMLFSVLKDGNCFSKECEITIETSHDRINRENLAAWEELQVNRLSLNLLGFELSQLKRVVSLAGAEGFENLNFDLHFDWPGQIFSNPSAQARETTLFN